jgi:hypothetical protein
VADADARIAERYDIVRPLGRGAFARTLLARDLKDDRLVAIKALHPRAVDEWKAYELFEREATTLRGLRHHGVPVVYEAFRAQWEGAETAFLVMEYVEGPSLAEIIAERRHLGTSDVLHLFDEMLGVLDYLHTRAPPVLHRDIKPSNVIVRPDGSPVLVDFGAVRSVFRAPDEAGSTVAGTFGYMPYEQLMGQASPASDLYALAATFLHVMTGRTPPEFMTDAGRIEVPSSLPCGDRVRGVLSRMLSPAPTDRYRSAREVRAAMLGDGAESASGNAVVPAAATAKALALPNLGPAPRPLKGEAKAMLDRLAFGTWRLMSPKEKPGTRWGVTDVLLAGFFTVLTAGVLPALFYSIARGRRRRLEGFLKLGEPAVARILEISLEKVAFDVQFTRVRYEFEADGTTHRNADNVLQAIADRWDRGSSIQILYIADRDYDSVIISTS